MTEPGRRFENKVLLITGATGIAAATARLAAWEGARIFIAALDEDECRALTGEIGGGYHAGDLRLADTAREAVRECLDRFDHIDALYNVAGISGRRFGDGPVDQCTDEGWTVTLDNNLTSLFCMCREVLRHMLEREPGVDGSRGVILNMASVSAFSPEPRHFATHAYAASKGAILSLTAAMAAYYAPQGIRVNAIAPGLVRTPMSRRAQEDPGILEYMRAKQPLAGGLMEPEEIGRASLFLLSEDARMITGQVFTVDAGWCVSAA